MTMRVVSFKVREEVKRKMDAYRGEVNWAEELRRFVERRLRELEARKHKQQIIKRLKRASWSVPKGFSVAAVRESRDRD